MITSDSAGKIVRTESVIFEVDIEGFDMILDCLGFQNCHANYKPDNPLLDQSANEW